jgi:hypothetical protein
VTAREWIEARFSVVWESAEGFDVVDPQTGGQFFIDRQDVEQAIA